MIAESAQQRIIWSADLPHEVEIYEHLKKVPGLRRVKIDRLFTERRDRFVLGTLKDQGIDVFYDAKFIEIPSKLEELAKVAVQYEPWMLNCMAGSVSSGILVHDDKDQIDGLKRFADVCLNANVLPCAVTVLTSKTESMAWKEFNGRNTAEQVIFYAGILAECGFTDIVCSPLEAQVLLAEGFDDLCLNTPGIRFADSDAGDQARTNTPGGAITSGVDRVVMGRDLTKGDPVANFARAVAEIEAAIAA